MKRFLQYIRERLITFLLNILWIVGGIVAIYYSLWGIYGFILLLLLGGWLLFKGIVIMSQRWKIIEERVLFIILRTHRITLVERYFVNHRALHSKAIFHILRQSKFHEINQIPIKYLPIVLKIIHDNHNLYSKMTPTAQKLIDQSVLSNYSLKSLFKIVSYYRLSPRELAQMFIKNHFLSPVARERLIYEAGYEERQILENNLAFDTPLLLQIAEKHQILLDSSYSLLL